MRFTALLLACLCLARAAVAHEFWISPQAYEVEPGEPIVADLRVGQDFEGSRQTYFPDRFARFEVKMGETVQTVEGRLGDMPAMTFAAPDEGLAVIVHETKGDSLKYKTRDLFEDFVAHKDLGDVLARHADRGLPELDFREAYTRYAKSLVAVGNGEGADAPVGLKTEIVALANPYTDDLSGGLPVRVLYDGAPRIDAQVEVFARDTEGTVTQSFYRTDDAGEATIPVASGTEYMVDAVVMEDTGNDDPEAGPAWHSAWANLTFRMP
ncbi:DUF4198 domain-containing protein [Maritimibacter sp. UBA3975]|uniref:DUF4198 domain-containing protein n=1 Tax=Maritimibacter sp. UBA3975 TaxID=1946833 RepID=UPI000C0AAC42|nr:DUF4198 domain-containing protein [Maritimibacter sp. UBA3975]MAM62066.1 hypothetical protein [Maritimibacter sp.]|tara:strand:- start:2321 stop:3121 length:801 start_codon:yes stop_codon:yes gene_type:complete